MSQPQSREIRVFLSSTFRDMEAERAHLIKTIFPRVRAACRARQVGFTEIDLRWGVTEEESKNGATVEICLKEIDRCRDFPPFFIGFLGERYGWIPRHDDLTAYWDRHAGSPYAAAIKDAVKRGISVTELEMELAVFGNEVTPAAYTPGEATDDRALFLLRDKGLSESFYATALAASSATREVDYIDAGEGKLEILKDKIRQSGLLKVDNYASVEMFGQMIEDHLLAALDRYFPADAVPSEEERIEAAHAVFKHHRLANFLPRPDVKAQIGEAIQARIDLPALGPLLVTGPSGQGKSAIMADLARSIEAGELSASRPLRAIDHYVGADGVDNLESWLRRLLYRLKPLIGDNALTIPEAPKDQKEAAVTWVARAARSSLAGGSPEAPVTFVLIVDALDQLNDRGKDLSLLMPDVLGADVVVVTSAAEGTSAIDSAKKWGKVEVPPLTAELRQAIIEDTLARFRKKLPPEDARRLAEAPQCGSPLFLTLALEELRVDAHHETLSTLVDHILQSGDAQSLFLNNFLLDPDYSRPQQPDLAVRFMALLGAAYAGLTEQQLADLLALPDDPISEDSGKPRLPQSALSHLLNNFGGFLLDKRDRRAPMHRLFGEIALQHCGEENIREQLYVAFHALADKSDDNKAEALHQVTWLADKVESEQAVWRDHLLDGIEAWIAIGDGDVLESALGLLKQDEREDLTVRWESTCSSLPDDNLENIANQWRFDMEWLERITFNQYQTSLRVTEALLNRLKLWNDKHEVTIETMASLGSFYWAMGRYHDANSLEKEVLIYFRDTLGPEHPDTLESKALLACTLSGQGDYAGARELEETVLEARRRLLGPEHPDTLVVMDNLACTLRYQGDYAGARDLHESALGACRRLLGPEHPDTLVVMGNLAGTLRNQGDYAGARELEETVLEAKRRLLGLQHPEALTTMDNLACTLSYQGDYAGARELHESALGARRRLLGPEHPATLTSMNNLAYTLSAQGDYAGARELEETVLEARRRLLGTSHPHTLTSMGNLAGTMSAQGDYAGACELEEAVLEARRRLLGPEHPDTLTTMANLATTLWEQTYYIEAISLRRERLDILESIYVDEDNEDLANGLHSLAVDMRNAGQIDEALPLQEKALAMFENLDGENSENAAYANSALGWLHHLRGDDALARPYLEKAVSIRVALFGDDHPSTNTAKERLASLTTTDTPTA